MTDGFNDIEQDELWERWRCEVDKGQGKERIDKYLAEHMTNTSRNRIADAGNVWANGKPVASNYRVKPGDVIQVLLDHEPHDYTITPENIPLDIVYEDEDLLVVNKPAGLVVHPGHGNFDGTLLNALAYHFKENGSKVDNGFGYLVHRIDKDTTGLMIVAKNETAQTVLAAQFFEHSITRRYQALVWGDFADDEGTVEGNIGRSMRDRVAMAVYPDGSQGKDAVTHYKVLERFNYVTLVECRLETGRTHQIRVHMQYAGHPLFNDALYGGDRILKGTTFSKYRQFIDNCFNEIPRHCLHAKVLGFVHPTTGKELFFDSELPSDMLAVLEKWRNYLKTRTEEN